MSDYCGYESFSHADYELSLGEAEMLDLGTLENLVHLPQRARGGKNASASNLSEWRNIASSIALILVIA